MSDTDLICTAIVQRRLLSFIYKSRRRCVEPHALGYDRDGDLTLSAWQLSGTTEGWRDFHLSKMTGLIIEQQTFLRPRPDYNPPGKFPTRLVCRL